MKFQVASGIDPVIVRALSSVADVQRLGTGDCEVFSTVLLFTN